MRISSRYVQSQPAHFRWRVDHNLKIAVSFKVEFRRSDSLAIISTMHRRNVLLGSLGCLLPISNPAGAQQKSDPGGSLKNYPALRRYLASLKSIPKGTFQLGSTSGSSDQRLKNTLRLSAFRMGATPVTVAVWKEYCAATGTPLPDAPPWGLLDDHPVVNVSWIDIMGTDGNDGFCKKNGLIFPLQLMVFGLNSLIIACHLKILVYMKNKFKMG